MVDPRNIPFFRKPFVGEFPLGNFFDHDIPKEHIDNNGTFVTFSGETYVTQGNFVDGHTCP